MSGNRKYNEIWSYEINVHAIKLICVLTTRITVHHSILRCEWQSYAYFPHAVSVCMFLGFLFVNKETFLTFKLWLRKNWNGIKMWQVQFRELIWYLPFNCSKMFAIAESLGYLWDLKFFTLTRRLNIIYFGLRIINFYGINQSI